MTGALIPEDVAIPGDAGFDPRTIAMLFERRYAQARAGQKDRIRADLDYQVNLKAQHEIMRLHEKFDQLAVERRARPQNAAPDGAGQPVDSLPKV